MANEQTIIDLNAERAARHEISRVNFIEQIKTVLHALKGGDYITASAALMSANATDEKLRRSNGQV